MILIIGAGIAGLSAAIHLAQCGISCSLFSVQPSERAQSALAEGGINGALDTMGEQDSPAEHFADTMRGGCSLADGNAVRGLTEAAPEILLWLRAIGVPFHAQNGSLILRNFGGQKKKRTAYAKSSTGKMIVTALIDEARKYEAQGIIHRYPHHEFLHLLLENGECRGVRIRDCFSNEIHEHFGAVILCSGGMNGIFPNMTTGTTQNSGNVTAAVFSQGVRLANLEMLQYHPTTFGISGKRCLLTEAARGEGGRLYIERNGKPWYFMEEKYPLLGNLMPRDVVAREMFFVRNLPECGETVYLDMTGLPETVWNTKLSDLRSEIMHYCSSDPESAPIPVHEGIHYFMGGIDVNIRHETNLRGLFAAGECACQYHGANRLGGNSLLGAVYGGKIAAQSASETNIPEKECNASESGAYAEPDDPQIIGEISNILLDGLGIVRSADGLNRALQRLDALKANSAISVRTQNRLLLAEAMLRSAEARRESRGAHYRSDYPEQNERYRKTTIAECHNKNVQISFRPLPEVKT